MTLNCKASGALYLELVSEEAADIETLPVTFNRSSSAEDAKYNRIGVVFVIGVKEPQAELNALKKFICSQNQAAQDQEEEGFTLEKI